MTCLLPERVLLTGANGFIGSCVNQYLEFKCAVAVRDPVKCGLNDRALLLSELINPQGDLSQFHGIDSIIHLAGLAHSKEFSAQEHDVVNTKLTLDLAKAAAKRGVKRFVFVSSINVNAIYAQDEVITIDSTPCSWSDSSRSKFNAEIGLAEIAKETGLELVIVRPTLVYGANAPGNFGSLSALISKLPFLPFGATTNERDFISVNNLASLLVTCAVHDDAPGHTFLACEGQAVSMNVFTSAIAKGLNRNLYQLPIPVSLMRFAGKLLGKSEVVEQLVGNFRVDSSNLKQTLGWIPPYTMEDSMSLLHQNKEK
ncbi:NAD-dependent epimerase/dehydratase family protein [Vibrio crassostreae]|uniref:NAD-dependent epimerase/dehydratase family protein n=1 Tax=Vibrio crassostreae TaxID=246167 RepID=UPI002E16E6EF|nr:NAD-dependent epimerase/dehydratase family protein [Vibrio crassostreae]